MRVSHITIRGAIPGKVSTNAGGTAWEFKLKISDAPCQTWRQAFLFGAGKPEFSAVAKYTLPAEPDPDEHWTIIGTCANAPQILTAALNNATRLVQMANDTARAEAHRQNALQEASASKAEREARARERQQREFEQTFHSVAASSGFSTRPHLSIRWKIFIGSVLVGLIAGCTTDDWDFGVHIVATVGVSLIWSLELEQPTTGYEGRDKVEQRGSLALFFLGLWISLILRIWNGGY